MIEIAIQEDFIPMGTRIYVTNKIGSTRSFLQPDGTWKNVEITDHVVREDVLPTVTLPMDLTREVYEALSRHFHGADDARALRKDYDAERRRVDVLQDALMTMTDRAFEVARIRMGGHHAQ